MTYRRLNFEEGPFESLTLLARAVSAQMLRLSDSDGCIRFSRSSTPRVWPRMSDAGSVVIKAMAGFLPRLMKEIVESGMWSWGTDSDGEIVLVPSPFVMTPPRSLRAASGRRRMPFQQRFMSVPLTLHIRCLVVVVTLHLRCPVVTTCPKSRNQSTVPEIISRSRSIRISIRI